jgi:uncharacterized membrane protein YoaK (UPF0700 family)
VSWERRHALLLGLTGAAGALDALSFVHLGKVFASFQSGNVLFLGLGIGDGNGGLVIRAGVVLVTFFIGVVGGAHMVGTRLAPGAPRGECRALATEAALLTAFAGLWLAIGTPDDHPLARAVLLALGAGAMGIQAALVLALKIPNVLTVALTATVAYLGQRVGTGFEAKPRGEELPSSGMLVAFILTYVTCAFVVAVLPTTPALSLAPVLVLLAALAVDRQAARGKATASASAA